MTHAVTTDDLESTGLPGCRYCGLVGPDGCRHHHTGVWPRPIAVPIHPPNVLAAPMLPRVISAPINPRTGSPLRRRSA